MKPYEINQTPKNRFIKNRKWGEENELFFNSELVKKVLEMPLSCTLKHEQMLSFTIHVFTTRISNIVISSIQTNVRSPLRYRISYCMYYLQTEGK